MFDDGLETITSIQQQELESKVLEFYRELKYDEEGDFSKICLERSHHVKYLHAGLGKLSTGYVFLDASRPWIVYWILNSLSLLRAPLPTVPSRKAIIQFLSQSQHPDGGYVGGPGQIPHVAPTYAAISSVVLLGGPEALESVNRQKVMGFLEKMCVGPEKGGGFTVHEGGEADMRACYTALAVAHMLNLDKELLVEKSGVVEYIRRCQTYEGGLGGEPGNEAHGGYTSCGVAALALIGHLEVLDIPRLLKWLVQRQGWMEGGFNGRTNKLVDGCYSFWQAGVFNVLRDYLDPNQLFRQVPDYPPDTADGAVDVPDLPVSLNAVPPLQQAESAAQAADSDAARHLNPDSNIAPDVDLILEGAHTGQAAAAINCLLVECSAYSLCASSNGPIPANPLHTASHPGPTAPSGHPPGSNLGGADSSDPVRTAASTTAAGAGSNADSAVGGDESASGLGGAEFARGRARGGRNHGTLPLYNTDALQLWVLQCCQGPKGGLRDKPGKSVDYYHTCYCLSGLAAAQQLSGRVLGSTDNKLTQNDPVCNVNVDKLREARAFYGASYES